MVFEFVGTLTLVPKNGRHGRLWGRVATIHDCLVPVVQPYQKHHDYRALIGLLPSCDNE